MKDMKDELKAKRLLIFAEHDGDESDDDGNKCRELAAQDSLAFDKVFAHKFEGDKEPIFKRMVNIRNESLTLDARKIMLSYLSKQQVETVRNIEDPNDLYKVLQDFFSNEETSARATRPTMRCPCRRSLKSPRLTLIRSFGRP